jgi:hypothetical protein
MPGTTACSSLSSAKTTRRTDIAQGLERKGSVPLTYTSSMQRKDLSAHHNLYAALPFKLMNGGSVGPVRQLSALALRRLF